MREPRLRKEMVKRLTPITKVHILRSHCHVLLTPTAIISPDIPIDEGFHPKASAKAQTGRNDPLMLDPDLTPLAKN